MMRPSLNLVIAVVLSALAVALAGALTWIAMSAATDRVRADASAGLEELAFQAADKLDRGMFERYREIVLLAAQTERFAADEVPALTNYLDALQASYDIYAWIGFAGTDGKVIAATRNMLVGADVSRRPWFAGALAGPFVGDVHSALMLEKLLPRQADGAIRFVDVAAPVVDEAGRLRGVLGAHLDWKWAQDVAATIFSPYREQAGREILIVAANGLVLLGPTELRDLSLELPTIDEARSGAPAVQLETWPDGRAYLTAASLARGYQSYPGLGWTVVVRQPAKIAFAEVSRIRDRGLLVGAFALVVAMIAGLFFSSYVTLPLRRMTRAAERLLHSGRRDGFGEGGMYREARLLGQALNRLVTDLTEREADLHRSSTHDALTGLANRLEFAARLRRRIDLAASTELHPAVIIVQLDGLDSVLSAFGHEVSDACLSKVATRLRAALPDTDTLARHATSEFAIIHLLRPDDEGEMTELGRLAVELDAIVRRPMESGQGDVTFGSFIGVGVHPDDGETAAQLIQNASAAAMLSRQAGGGVHYSGEQYSKQIVRRLSLESELRRALDRDDQLFAQFQPQVDGNGRTIGAEALARWRNEDGRFVSPAEFIPAAESSGMIVPLGDYMLEAACQGAAAWRKAGLRVGFNVSPLQLTPDFPDKVMDALRRHALPASALEIEITESLLVADQGRERTVIDEVAALGIDIAIDDFGTGYSSLAYLSSMPVTRLKIDQAFVRKLMKDHHSAAICRAIIMMARGLRRQVIAEGVEDEDQFVALRSLGCHEFQGYLISRPIDAGAFTEFLRRPAVRYGADLPAA